VLIGAKPINEARHTVVVIPLSSVGKPNPPLVISVSCLGKQVVAVCDQIRAVDKSRLIKEAGSISKKGMEELEEGLRKILAL
jgi:mRNA interferase MazF